MARPAAPAGRFSRLAQRGLLPLRRAWSRRRVGRLVLEHLDGMPLIVLPDVFNPAVFRTTAQLVGAIDEHVAAGMRVLDLGTGSGAAAIRAARRGAIVTAVDVNPEAVRCARMNALLNRVEDRVEVRQGDLFAPVAGTQFDVIVCNPPFFAGRPSDLRDRAWRSEDFLERLAAGFGTALHPAGCALIVFSSDGDEPSLLATLAAAGYRATAARSRDFGNEIITVYLVSRAGAGS